MGEAKRRTDRAREQKHRKRINAALSHMKEGGGGIFAVQVIDRYSMRPIEAQARAGDKEMRRLMDASEKYISSFTNGSSPLIQPLCFTCDQVMAHPDAMPGAVVVITTESHETPSIVTGICEQCSRLDDRMNRVSRAVNDQLMNGSARDFYPSEPGHA